MTTTMHQERPGVDYNDGAGEAPIGSYAARIDAEVIEKAGKEALKVHLTFEDTLGETAALEANGTNELEVMFWLRNQLPTKPDGTPNKYVAQNRREWKQFVAATGQELPDLSDFGNLEPLKTFAATIQDSTVNVRTFRKGNGSTGAAFDVRL